MTAKPPPLLSVIVPCYNSAAWLERCLDSILGQKLRDIELICVDDGSKDGTPEMLAAYAAKDDRVKVLRQANGGISAARNAGLGVVSARFVTFVDHDDWVLPDVYAASLPAMLDDGEIDYACWNYDRVFVEDDGSIVRFREGCAHPSDWKGKTLLTGDMKYPENVRDDVMVWNKIFRMETLERYAIDFPVGRACEDILFSWEYKAVSRYAYFVPESLSMYREHRLSTSGSTTRDDERRLEYYDIICLTLDFFRRHNLGGYDKYMSRKLDKARYLMGAAPANWRRMVERAREVAVKYDLPDTEKHYVMRLKRGDRNPAGLNFWLRRVYNKVKDERYATYYLFGIRVLRTARRRTVVSR